MTMMKKSIGLPSTQDPIPIMVFSNNTAMGYGEDISTLPCLLVVVGDVSTSMIPGIDLLNVSIALKDCFDNRVKGTSRIPIPYILNFWICPSEACSIEQSLSPLKFLSFNSVSGISSSLEAEQTVLCSSSSPNITVYFSVYGSTLSATKTQLLASSASVRCAGCGRSQVRTEQQLQNITAWTCTPCLPGQYIIDPDKDSCNKCPLGTACFYMIQRYLFIKDEITVITLHTSDNLVYFRHNMPRQRILDPNSSWEHLEGFGWNIQAYQLPRRLSAC
jgi:hypothetical protein